MLWQNQTAFWGSFIDWDNENDQVEGFDQILDQRIFVRVFRFQRGNFFFQFLDVHAVGSTDQNFYGADGHGKILDLFGRKQINLIIYDQIRDAFFMKTVNQFKFFFAFTGRTVNNKNCDICFVQNLITFADTE